MSQQGTYLLMNVSQKLFEALSNFNLDLPLIQQILEDDPSVLTVTDAYGQFPIQIAARRCNLSLIKIILDFGGDLELTNPEGKTPVAIACQNGSINAVHAFKECGANMNTLDSSGRTLMHHAAGIGAVHVMHYLHEVCGIAYNDKDREGYTPLHMACWNKSTEAVRYLLKKKCNANAANMYGTTPLSIAVKNGSYTICRLLILSTNQNLLLLKDGNGYSPCDHAEKGTTTVHKELRYKLASWTFAHLNKSFPFYDTFLYYGMMVAPGLSLTAAMFMLIYFPYLLVSTPVALVIILFGFFGTIINHRLPHDAQYQNPGAFGAFLSGLILTVICYFTEVFPLLWPSNFVWFLIVAVDYILILVVFWKIEHTDPGFDKIGKIKSDGAIMSILNIAKQDYTQKDQVQYSFCTKCEIVIPEFTKHCKLCEACCNGFDHHCLWLRTCIGKNNHRLFVVFLLTLVLDNMLFVRSVLSALVTLSGSYNPLEFLMYAIANNRFMLFLMVCNFATGIFGLLNFVYQLSIISVKETTYFDASGNIAYMRKRRPTSIPLTVRLAIIKEFFFNYDKWFSDKLKSRNAFLV